MKTLHTQATLLLKRLFRLERCGKYEEALAELKDVWKDTTTFPDVGEFEPRAAAEILLRCGSLIGFFGHNKQIPNSQEKSKNLLSEARSRFLDIKDVEKTAECENYLALAYWRTGELVEAETWIAEALTHNLQNSNQIRLYSFIIRCLVFFQLGRFNENIELLKNVKSEFLRFGCNSLKGDFYNHYGLNLRNLDKFAEAQEKYELAKHFHQKSGHRVYLGTIENNLAYLYKASHKFVKAHEAIDNSTKIFKQIKDKTREGFSFDTKAQIYLAEKKYEDALKAAEKAVQLLKQSENKAYLVEGYLTCAKTLIYLEDIAGAHLCLSDAVQIARVNISEDAAKALIGEFEKTRREKISPAPVKDFKEEIKEETSEESLELILPPSIAHYQDIQGVRIKNSHLEDVGLRKNSLAIIVQEKINRGDLAAIAELTNNAVSCGFYDSDFGIVCLEGTNSELQLFDERDIRILGKIVGVCTDEKDADGKMIVEAINP